MRADRVSVDDAHGSLLPATSLLVRPGELAVVAGPHGGHGHSAFGLVATGRLAPSGGSVSPGAAVLREWSALVDAPGVSAPEPNLTVADVVAEELALAGAPAGRAAVKALVDARGLPANGRFETVEPADRVRLLTDLAARRPGVGLLVLDTPDRHGDGPDDWWDTAVRHARDGLAVIALVGAATARLLPVTAARLGDTEQPEPLLPEPVEIP